MVLILDGSLEIRAHVQSDICLTHLFRNRAVINQRFFPQKTCTTCSELPSNINTMIEVLLHKVSEFGIADPDPNLLRIRLKNRIFHRSDPDSVSICFFYIYLLEHSTASRCLNSVL